MNNELSKIVKFICDSLFYSHKFINYLNTYLKWFQILQKNFMFLNTHLNKADMDKAIF